MITEDYISFETAKLLKEKGFDAQCRAAYTDYGKLFTTQIQQYITNILCSKGYHLWECVAPTHQMAMRWLREIHKIHVSIYPYGEYSCDNYQFDVYKNNKFIVSKDDGYMTYEQACEAAIKYCLENLI